MKVITRMTDCLLAITCLFVAAVGAPQLFGLEVYTVLSASMMPEIPVGSAVYVKKTAFENIRTGDIITYCASAGGVYVTHRVAGKDEEARALVAKGDANEQPDGRLVHEEEVLGVVRFTVPCLGYAAMLFGGIGEKLILAGLFLWLVLIKMILVNILKIREKGVTLQ